jgi:hypothetical protein
MPVYFLDSDNLVTSSLARSVKIGYNPVFIMSCTVSQARGSGYLILFEERHVTREFDEEVIVEFGKLGKEDFAGDGTIGCRRIDILTCVFLSHRTEK